MLGTLLQWYVVSRVYHEQDSSILLRGRRRGDTYPRLFQ